MRRLPGRRHDRGAVGAGWGRPGPERALLRRSTHRRRRHRPAGVGERCAGEMGRYVEVVGRGADPHRIFHRHQQIARRSRPDVRRSDRHRRRHCHCREIG